jgi:hypothetical protein
VIWAVPSRCMLRAASQGTSPTESLCIKHGQILRAINFATYQAILCSEAMSLKSNCRKTWIELLNNWNSTVTMSWVNPSGSGDQSARAIAGSRVGEERRMEMKSETNQMLRERWGRILRAPLLPLALWRGDRASGPRTTDAIYGSRGQQVNR